MAGGEAVPTGRTTNRTRRNASIPRRDGGIVVADGSKGGWCPGEDCEGYQANSLINNIVKGHLTPEMCTSIETQPSTGLLGCQWFLLGASQFFTPGTRDLIIDPGHPYAPREHILAHHILIHRFGVR